MTGEQQYVGGSDDIELRDHSCASDDTSAVLEAHRDRAMSSRREPRATSQRERRPRINTRTALLSLLATAPLAMAQECISLSGSTQCSAFGSASISTNKPLVDFFPFLKYVSDRASFDQQLSTYVSTGYALEKYQNLLGCQNIDLRDTSNLYARYTTTVICNAIIQNSRVYCDSGPDPRPTCAETCVQFAESESLIKSNPSLCANPGDDANELIRADFTNCALPTNALTGACIEGSKNEPYNCGYGDSTIGFCEYCGSGGQNSTDTCCYNADAETRCAGVKLPTITAFMTFSTTSPTGTPSPSPSDATAAIGSKKLSGGAIAGIVVGSVVGVALLAGLIFFLLMCLRRRQGSQNGSIFNQPSPARKGPNQQDMAYNNAVPAPAATISPGYEVLPGGRIARMSALEGHSGDSPPRSNLPSSAAAGAAAGYAAGRRRRHDNSSSSEYGDSPISNSRGILRPPPARRQGSLSSNSALGVEDPQSPISGSGGELSSPQGLTSQQSEQLTLFKDYYSQDDIHPGDKVATLWAYQPRAGDEFALERGDMLKVVGIWDDGWATGVLTDERAEDWEAKRDGHRDSGVSHTSGFRDDSPARSSEIKAFPLVCVCLPDHWRKTIEGDGSTETGSMPGPSGMHA